MKIRFLRTITVDVEKPRRNETDLWTKSFNKWDEVRVEDIFVSGHTATLKSYEGEFYFPVPVDSFERLPETNNLFYLEK
jgi:hypothetical protein